VNAVGTCSSFYADLHFCCSALILGQAVTGFQFPWVHSMVVVFAVAIVFTGDMLHAQSMVDERDFVGYHCPEPPAFATADETVADAIEGLIADDGYVDVRERLTTALRKLR
jgi:hypothetical protein